jgi:hypothetical protein
MLRKIGSKKISKPKIKQFWKDFDTGKKDHSQCTFKQDGTKRTKPRPPYFNLSGTWTRKPFVVSPGLLGTVRTFKSRIELINFIKRFNKTNKLANLTFQNFTFQPTEILAIDRKNLRILEKVYPATTVSNILNPIKK